MAEILSGGLGSGLLSARKLNSNFVALELLLVELLDGQARVLFALIGYKAESPELLRSRVVNQRHLLEFADLLKHFLHVVLLDAVRQVANVQGFACLFYHR